MRIDIEETVRKIIDGAFEIEEANEVPNINDPRLNFDSKGLSFEATVVYVQMRDAVEILTKHSEAVLARARMAHFYVIAEIADSLGGVIRRASDNAVYVFFPGTTQDSLNSGVKAAMKIKYMLANEFSRVKRTLETYDAINFAIGVDDGKVLCVKVGSEKTQHGDLVWSGKPLQMATEIADRLKAPEHIGISELVHYNLDESIKYNKAKDTLGNIRKLEIWRPDSFTTYNGEEQKYYYTSFFWTVS